MRHCGLVTSRSSAACLPPDCAEYEIQLLEYIRYTRGEMLTVLKTWRSLQAYRATVPVGALATSTELYFLNVAIALEVLGTQAPGTVRLVRGPAV